MTHQDHTSPATGSGQRVRTRAADPHTLADTDPTLRAIGDTIPGGLAPIPATGPVPGVPASEPTLPAPAATAPPSPGSGSVVQRVLVALGLVILLVTSLALDQWVFTIVAMIVVLLGLQELALALRAASLAVPIVPLVVSAGAMIIVTKVAGSHGLVAAYFISILAVLAWRALEGGGRQAMWDGLAAVFALTYVPLLTSFLVLIGASPLGNWRVLYAICLCMACDTGGWALGSLMGRHKIAPTVSPKKSWEGFAGSLILTIAIGALGLWLLGGTWWAGALIGVAGVASSTLGDLAESLLKRDLGIKDMGTLLPGHGGVMDRIDSILLTAPIAYVGLLWALGG